MLAARPLVVSDHSGLREAAAGYASAQSVTADRAAEWADAVERVAGDWATFREAALVDAQEARRRHAPERYRDRLVQVVTSLRGRAPAPRPGPTWASAARR